MTDSLEGTKPQYDVVVIGSGLGGLTAANMLAKDGYSVLLLEHHHKLGGLATWFKRKGGHIFDVSLHGFPYGMVKTCRKYWTREMADCITQIKGIRFDNPQFSLTTTYDTNDFKRTMQDYFKVPADTVDSFVTTIKNMNFYDEHTMTTREMFDKFFPGRDDVVRFLLEPIAYANGSTLDDEAITYGIVFSNFLSRGVYIFRGGTDKIIGMMEAELKKNGVDIRTGARVEKIVVEGGKVAGVVANGKTIKARAVISNANVKATVQRLVGEEHFSKEFAEETRKVRLNNSSCQVYIGIRKGETIDYVGDLLFTSVADKLDAQMLRSRNITSRTYSFYYPDIRPGSDRYAIVASTNANYEDWAYLPEDEYRASKQDLIESTLDALERYVPGIRNKADYVEAATPKTFERYTLHPNGTSFGTKFEGLRVSMGLNEQVPGLFHTGSVGIIMSGWLGAANYGVIVANNADKYLRP
ncbi:MAG: phytoene dehydrogenase [Chloroflexi bacterium]|nr:MAG: phytoene dehydrogenase [Chloroflexota bacterium]RLC96551.1 MAG: phytoene dehydrogenase [Chloroflexota bacterium]